MLALQVTFISEGAPIPIHVTGYYEMEDLEEALEDDEVYGEEDEEDFGDEEDEEEEEEEVFSAPTSARGSEGRAFSLLHKGAMQSGSMVLFVASNTVFRLCHRA